MKSALLLAAIALGVSAQDLTINTPVQGTVTGAAPYIVSVDTSPAGAAHVADFGTQSGTSITWTVNATVGTSLPPDPFRRTQLILNIKDNTGLGKTSAVFPVLTGSGDGCIGAGGTTGGSAPPSGSTTAPAGSTPASGGSSTPASGGSSTPAAGGGSSKASSSASSSGAKTSTTPGAAMAVQAPVGVAAFLAGLIALLA
ncbi:hypothetical protein DFH08DRAFT_798471 [Mycena albidolilacea]|uniref:Uncharacterized protein n=1 Tax=Mycena albidolilacea TaxID=1033008 RepID=A0AAD7ANS6_9AGAR|nr:hypothetical protein DFH08DRAFT_798471 [Mycena albidolilacea]